MASKKVPKRKTKKKTIRKIAKKPAQKRKQPRDSKGRFVKTELTKEEEEKAYEGFVKMMGSLIEEEIRYRKHKEEKQALYESHVKQVIGNKWFADFKREVTKNFHREPDWMRDLYRDRIRHERKKGKEKFVAFMRGEMLLLDALRVVDHNYYGVKIVDRVGKRPVYEYADYFDDDVVPDAGELWDIYHEA